MNNEKSRKRLLKINLFRPYTFLQFPGARDSAHCFKKTKCFSRKTAKNHQRFMQIKWVYFMMEYRKTDTSCLLCHVPRFEVVTLRNFQNNRKQLTIQIFTFFLKSVEDNLS